MKKFCLFLFILNHSVAIAQNSNKELNEIHQQIDMQRAMLDSYNKKSEHSVQEQMKSNNAASMANRIVSDNSDPGRSIQDIKEKFRKEKQDLWLMAVLGLLIIVIFVKSRHRKK